MNKIIHEKTRLSLFLAKQMYNSHKYKTAIQSKAGYIISNTKQNILDFFINFQNVTILPVQIPLG